MKKCSSEDLKKAFELEQSKMKWAREAYPWQDQKAYIQWLVNTYEYVQKSTRILALIGGRMPISKTKFSNRFISHAAEEKGHEKLIENDLRKFGSLAHELKASAIAKAFHQSLYYSIYETSAIEMFGWVLALEGFAVNNVPQMHAVCRDAHGSDKVSFLKVHADEDPDHLDKAFQSIAEFNDEENFVVLQTMKFYSELYSKAMLSLPEKSLVKAA